MVDLQLQEEHVSEATRYLCAGAYLDDTFRGAVLTEVVDDRFRAVAPSHGVDIIPVIRHCLRARGRGVICDLVLAVMLIALVKVHPQVALTLLGFGVITAGVRAIRRLRARLRTSTLTPTNVLDRARRAPGGCRRLVKADPAGFREFQGLSQHSW